MVLPPGVYFLFMIVLYVKVSLIVLDGPHADNTLFLTHSLISMLLELDLMSEYTLLCIHQLLIVVISLYHDSSTVAMNRKVK